MLFFNMRKIINYVQIDIERLNIYFQVETLLLGLFYHKGNLPIFDKKYGETIDSKSFDAQSGVLMEKEEGDFVD